MQAKWAIGIGAICALLGVGPAGATTPDDEGRDVVVEAAGEHGVAAQSAATGIGATSSATKAKRPATTASPLAMEPAGGAGSIAIGHHAMATWKAVSRSAPKALRSACMRWPSARAASRSATRRSHSACTPKRTARPVWRSAITRSRCIPSASRSVAARRTTAPRASPSAPTRRGRDVRHDRRTASEAHGGGATAYGGGSIAYGFNTTALGYAALAQHEGTAVGCRALAADLAVALGFRSTADVAGWPSAPTRTRQLKGTAIGAEAWSIAEHASAFGSHAIGGRSMHRRSVRSRARSTCAARRWVRSPMRVRTGASPSAMDHSRCARTPCRWVRRPRGRRRRRRARPIFRQIVNVAAGTEANDVVIKAQLDEAIAGLDGSIGSGLGGLQIAHGGLELAFGQLPTPSPMSPTWARAKARPSARAAARWMARPHWGRDRSRTRPARSPWVPADRNGASCTSTTRSHPPMP